jgi:hypothetical protein
MIWLSLVLEKENTKKKGRENSVESSINRRVKSRN